MRRPPIAAGTIAAATADSTAFGGVALAYCHDGGHSDHRANHLNSRGGDGVGEATNNCLNLGIPILSGVGIGGSGESDGARCTAIGNAERWPRLLNPGEATTGRRTPGRIPKPPPAFLRNH